jgi:hypothetical protein
MKFPLSRTVVRETLKMEDSICALLLLHARKSGLVEEPDDLKILRKELQADALYGPRWLLAYEANIKGWFRFRGAKDYVAADRNFKILKKVGVSFYDETKTILPSEAPVRIKTANDYLSKITFGYGNPITQTKKESDESEDENEINEY